MDNLILTAQPADFPLGTPVFQNIASLNTPFIGFSMNGFSEILPGLLTENGGISNLNLGLFHGFIFSIPFSVPILICVYRFLVEGILAGSLATAGTVLGQICFLSFILSSGRGLVQFWYLIEPFLAFFGFALALKLATDFYNGGASKSFATAVSGGYSSNLFGGLSTKNWINKNSVEALKIFGFNFIFMFLNPAMPGNSTRILAASPFLTNYGNSAGEFFTYNLGFIGTSSLCIGIFWPVVISALIQLFNRGRAVTSFATGQLLTRLRPGGNSEGDFESSQKRMGSYEAVLQPRFLSFLIVGCLITGGLQYSWRLFTQYPLEALQFGQSAEYRTTAREFPSFDSNIRHRDKNLPVDRHVPIEKMNSRRTLSGRPPLSEEQKSDAYFKFNSFFVNNLEQKFETQLIHARLGEKASAANQIRGYEEIDYLQKLKTQFQSLETVGNSILDIHPRNLENNTKGKPKFAYIRELTTTGVDLKSQNTTTNPFLHDELQLYGALLK